MPADVPAVLVDLARTFRALVDGLLEHGFALREVGDVRRFIADTRVVPAVHRRSRLPVDVVIAGPGLEEEMRSRARMRVVRRTRIPFVDLADLVVLEVLASARKRRRR